MGGKMMRIKGSEILIPAGYRHLPGKVCETIWLRAGCPGQGGAGILPAASHSLVSCPYFHPVQDDWGHAVDAFQFEGDVSG
jgi:hypothetical protein